MSDVKLTVGINEQLSFDSFDAGIKNVIKRINNQKYKIKVDLSDDSLTKFRNQIDDTVKAIKSIGKAIVRLTTSTAITAVLGAVGAMIAGPFGSMAGIAISGFVNNAIANALD